MHDPRYDKLARPGQLFVNLTPVKVLIGAFDIPG